MLNPEGLVCPLDQSLLATDGNSLTCKQGHRFDKAKQGYCHLLPVQAKRSKEPGDSKEMVLARAEFLDSGVYQPIAQFLWQQLAPLVVRQKTVRLADAGCGEGYYLDFLQQSFQAQQQESRLIGFDISKWAVAKAAKRNSTISWLVASNRQPPIEPAYLDLYLCMFGFPCYQPFAHSLKAGGYLLLIDAGKDHLIELRELIYDEIKPHREFNLAPAQQTGFELISETQFRRSEVLLNAEQIAQLMLMTPHFFRASQAAKAKLATLTELKITLDCCCRVFQLQG